MYEEKSITSQTQKTKTKNDKVCLPFCQKTFFLPKTLFHFIQRVSASFYLLNFFFFFFNKTKCVYISAEEKSDVRKIKKQIFLMIEK